MLVFPIGMLIWAWTAQAQTHWIGPLIGSGIFAFGLMAACKFAGAPCVRRLVHVNVSADLIAVQTAVNSIQNWLVDAFFPHSAAATAAATMVRSVLGCVLPIFAQSMFLNLGYGWGGTLLALVSLVSRQTFASI